MIRLTAAFALAVTSQAAFAQQRPAPYTLVISDGNAMTRVDYPTKAKCEAARYEVQLQTDARLTNTNPGVIYGAPRVTAFCVPL